MPCHRLTKEVVARRTLGKGALDGMVPEDLGGMNGDQNHQAGSGVVILPRETKHVGRKY